jgi:hypothetical protein
VSVSPNSRIQEMERSQPRDASRGVKGFAQRLVVSAMGSEGINPCKKTQVRLRSRTVGKKNAIVQRPATGCEWGRGRDHAKKETWGSSKHIIHQAMPTTRMYSPHPRPVKMQSPGCCNCHPGYLCHCRNPSSWCYVPAGASTLSPWNSIPIVYCSFQFSQHSVRFSRVVKTHCKRTRNRHIKPRVLNICPLCYFA